MIRDFEPTHLIAYVCFVLVVTLRTIDVVLSPNLGGASCLLGWICVLFLFDRYIYSPFSVRKH